MNSVLIIAGGILVLIVLLAIIFRKKEEYPYTKRKFLMSVPERKFYEELYKMVDGSKYVVLPQVPLSRVIEVTKRGKDFWKYHNRINKKILDFVIFKKLYYEPMLVIEYDDKSHERKERRKRDEFLDKALEKAGLKIVHVKYGEKISSKMFQNTL